MRDLKCKDRKVFNHEESRSQRWLSCHYNHRRQSLVLDPKELQGARVSGS